MFLDYYRGKRVLVTGHSGFKGGWLCLWLKQLGAQVQGLSLPAPTQPNLHSIIAPHALAGERFGDIRDGDWLRAEVARTNPEIVFHLAAQPIVRRSYVEPMETLQTNVLGTANLLEAVRAARLGCPVVVITSDKCYENREWDYAYRENDPLGGHDVYSMSKGATELVAQSWNRSFFMPDPELGPVVTVRAGNVIGGGDYATDRIVPDCIRALDEKRPIVVRNPAAVRPWQHVLECLSGYLWLGARLCREGKNSPLVGAFNFGPDPAARQPVQKLVEQLLRSWPGQWVDGSEARSVHEAKLLTLSIDKASARLGWRPVWEFEETVRRTVEWYHRRHTVANADMLAFSTLQIEEYAAAAALKQLSWTQ